MIDNEGVDVKLYNQFDGNSRRKGLSLLKINKNDESIIISNCKFTTNMNEVKASSLIYYVSGAPIEMKECSFIEKLSTGCHYIGGKIINEKCQFGDNQFNSIKLINHSRII